MSVILSFVLAFVLLLAAPVHGVGAPEVIWQSLEKLAPAEREKN